MQTQPFRDILDQAADALAHRAGEYQPYGVRKAHVMLTWHAARLAAGRAAAKATGGGEWCLCGAERELRAAITKTMLEWGWWDDDVRGAA